MRVLHVFSKLDKGGAELRTISLYEKLHQEGVVFDFLCLSGQKGELDDSVIQKGSNIYYIDLKKITSVFYILKLLFKSNYKIVHSHVHYTSGIIALLSRITKVPIRISHLRSTGNGKKKNKLNEAKNLILKKIMITFSTNVLCVSQSVKDSLGNSKKNKKVEVLYNGFSDEVIFRNAKKNKNQIIHVGRMIPDKNHLKVLKIFKVMLAENRDLNLVFVGKENQIIKAEMTSYIENNELNDKVSFYGVRSDVSKLFRESQLMIYPSKREGLPGSVIEALLNETSVLGSNIPSIVELQEYFDDLLVLSTEQSTEDWANLALEILKKQQDNKPIFSTGQFESSSFHINKHVEEIKKLYEFG